MNKKIPLLLVCSLAVLAFVLPLSTKAATIDELSAQVEQLKQKIASLMLIIQQRNTTANTSVNTSNSAANISNTNQGTASDEDSIASQTTTATSNSTGNVYSKGIMMNTATVPTAWETTAAICGQTWALDALTTDQVSTETALCVVAGGKFGQTGSSADSTLKWVCDCRCVNKGQLTNNQISIMNSIRECCPGLMFMNNSCVDIKNDIILKEGETCPLIVKMTLSKFYDGVFDVPRFKTTLWKFDKCGQGLRCDTTAKKCVVDENCAAAGKEITKGSGCCAGLKRIQSLTETVTGDKWECKMAGGLGICTNCGNGTCDAGENRCNCARDCMTQNCNDLCVANGYQSGKCGLSAAKDTEVLNPETSDCNSGAADPAKLKTASCVCVKPVTNDCAGILTERRDWLGIWKRTCYTNLTCLAEGERSDVVLSGLQSSNLGEFKVDPAKKYCCGTMKLISNTALVNGVCETKKERGTICANCGNGTCGAGENTCNCPQDCK